MSAPGRPARRGRELPHPPGPFRTDTAVLCGWASCTGRLGTILATGERVEWVLPEGVHRASDGVIRPTRTFQRRGMDPKAGRRRRAGPGTPEQRERWVVGYWTGPWPAVIECPRCGRLCILTKDFLLES